MTRDQTWAALDKTPMILRKNNLCSYMLSISSPYFIRQAILPIACIFKLPIYCKLLHTGLFPLFLLETHLSQ